MAHLTASTAQPRQNHFRMVFGKPVSGGMALQNHLDRAGPKTRVEQQGSGGHA